MLIIKFNTLDDTIFVGLNQKGKIWKKKQRSDYILYDAVNKVLNLTIQELYAEDFQSRLQRYESMRDVWTKASEKLVTGKNMGYYYSTNFSGKNDETLNDWLNNLSAEEQELMLKNQWKANN